MYDFALPLLDLSKIFGIYRYISMCKEVLMKVNDQLFLRMREMTCEECGDIHNLSLVNRSRGQVELSTNFREVLNSGFTIKNLLIHYTASLSAILRSQKGTKLLHTSGACPGDGSHYY